jgi:hypothetical protein
MTALHDNACQTARYANPPCGDDIMTRALADRLAQLRTELADGQQALRALDIRRDQMTADLLRIQGAVQVLEELLAAPPTRSRTGPA